MAAFRRMKIISLALIYLIKHVIGLFEYIEKKGYTI